MMRRCCPHGLDAARFFSRLAWLQRRRYQRAGLDRSQRLLVQGLTQAGIQGAALLEVGSGVGYLHQHLLQAGAARATGIDLAERMIDEARTLAKSRGLEMRTDYRVGDFVDLADTFEPAEVVILDKVICCYPDAQTLVRKSIAKALRLYAYTLPRDRWYTRAGVALTAAFMRLIGSRFRPFVHDPEQVAGAVTAAGFRKHYENRTLIWLTQVYVRQREETATPRSP
jgi:magnesium-protoporphyrin O-methyltransferase